MTLIPKDARIFVAGHGGLIGSAVVRKLEAEGYTNILRARRDQLDPLEPTNEAYPPAKIAGIKLCQSTQQGCNFLSARTPRSLGGQR